MDPISNSFDQPTQTGKTGGKKLTRQQKSLIYSGLGGAVSLAGGSALAWGMSQDGKPNQEHPKTEAKPTDETASSLDKPNTSAEASADSTKVSAAPQPEVASRPNSAPESSAANESTPANEPTVATHVTDEMSFEDAFKTARQEVGPGGYFEWNGHLYNTYYKEEWEALSPSEREEYTASVYHDDPSSSSYTTASNETSKADIRVGEYQGHTVALGDADRDGDAEVIVFDGTTGAIDKDNDGIMETRVELDPNTHEVVNQTPLATTFEAPKMSDLQTGPARVTTASTTGEGEMEVHHTQYQGHDVILGDTNHDGDAEVLIVDGVHGFVDKDNDGILETQVELDPTTQEIVGQYAMAEVFNAPSMHAFDTPQPVETDSPTQEVEVVKTTIDGQEFNASDLDNDGYVDIVVAENGLGAVDRDGDHRFETAIQIDMTTGEVVATAPMEHTYEVPTMDSISPVENTEVAHDFDNNADVSEWVA
ncbi:hypothetical protein ACO2Q8_04465 [Larkinella sp. VNQ87]|uniref:hypothetical protein n=1 Tax=Larkinella sp. VNQ87 TaxID=3400921 RepID=UPI003C0BE16B